ncbi:MAG: acyl-CoA thioesterase [Campylobacter sp.]|nr:acyl-CoA thioesterase [Campylobacter sp.]MBR7047908.1 acyl-CoA thioesterase [Campylobacter sp.]
MIFGGKVKKSYKFRVEFYDTDSMGVVWHGNYVKYCEMARCAFLREIGYTYIDMKNDGYAYPIVKMDFKFVRPAMFDDEICVSIDLLEFESLLKFGYKITNAKTGEILCKAHTAQAAVNIATMETCFYLPEVFKEKLKGL